MLKAYKGHEFVYRGMRKKDIRSWNENQRRKYPEITSDTKRFLRDTLAQPWAPKSGRVIELGCGTGPILRWLCTKRFSGLGIDVSKTAISMAKAQTKGESIKFIRADICRIDTGKIGKFDLVIDGHCLHCIISSSDRKIFFKNGFNLLKKGGIFIIMSMCCPVDIKIFMDGYKEQKYINNTVYIPWDKAGKFEDSVVIDSRYYIPTRKILHWKNILSEIRSAGFKIQMFRYNEKAGKEPFGDLSVAAFR